MVLLQEDHVDLITINLHSQVDHIACSHNFGLEEFAGFIQPVGPRRQVL